MAEPDLTRRLSHLAEHPVAASGLPAEEVRRRGDRLRRQRQTMVAVGAAAAVAVIATTGAVAGGALDRAGGPQPAPPASTSPAPRASDSAVPERLDEIPPTFPIGAGLGDPTDVTESPLLADRLTWCVDLALSDFSLVDSLSAEHAGGETSEVRTLLLFAESARAAAAEEALLSAAAGCPHDGDPEVRREPVPASPNWPGATLLASFPAESGGMAADILHIVRSGPALLLSSSYRTPDDVAATRADLDPVVTALAELTGEEPAAPSVDAPTSPEPLGPTGPREIPDGFPLAAGWDPTPAEPGGGISGPNRTLAPLEFRACGEALAMDPDARPRDVLRAESSAPEDYRSRQLSTYPDASAAVTAMAQIVEHYRSCPTSQLPQDELETSTQVRRLGLGGESWAILRRDTFDGAETSFGSTMVVVRLGRAVLVTTHGGHAGYPSGDGSGAIDDLVGEAAASIAAMCRFTEAGC